MSKEKADMEQWHCRFATLKDAEALITLQEDCTHKLGGEFYNGSQIDSFLREIGTLDLNLIHHRTYYVVEQEGEIVGSGGWSDRPAPFEKFHCNVGSPDRQPRIMAVFVRPGHTRRGIGRAVIAQAEDEIRQRGYNRVELTAMLSGVCFYSSLGYRITGNATVELSNGVLLPTVEMVKDLDLSRRETLPERWDLS
jgi:GNAT superfamily N-acetyltransferase